MIRVLFVCLGNICRSPLAEALFRQAIAERGLQAHFFIDSAGTNGLHNGSLPDPRTRKNAIKHGLDLTHQSRQIQATDFDQFDLFLVMDSQNRHAVMQWAPKGFDVRKIQMMRKWDMEHPDADVEDPWYGGEAGFETTYQVLLTHAHLWADVLAQTTSP